MEYLVGILTAVALAGFARSSGFEKDRSFYPTVLIVIGFLYVVFGAIDGRVSVILIELIFAFLFASIAVVGYKNNGVIVAGGIALHGVFDFVRYFFIEDKGVPVFWAGFCGTVDILLGIYVWFVCRKQNYVSAGDAA